MPTARTTQPLITSLMIFSLPAVTTLATYSLTRLNFVGPGVSAAWAATTVGAGQPADAVFSPLFKLILWIVGVVPASCIEPHQLAGWLNVILMAASTGVFALLLERVMRNWAIWGSNSIAMFGGVLAGVTVSVWTVSLTINPAPLASALLILSIWWLARDATARRQTTGTFLFSLALTAHLANVLFIPIILWLIFRDRRAGLVSLLLVWWLPFALFFLPSLTTVFRLSGLFSQPLGLPVSLDGVALFGWSAWQALTPVALIFAVAGLAWVAIRKRSALIIPLLLLIPLLAGAFVPIFSDYATVMIGFAIAALVVFGLTSVFNRLPRGLSLLMWIIIPMFWIWRGPEVNRHGEDLWEVHAENVIATQRANSLILTTDHERLMAPFIYMQEVRNRRPDLVLLDPTLLSDERYLDLISSLNMFSSPEAQQRMTELKESLSSASETEIKMAETRFLFATVDDALLAMKGGVLVSSDLNLGPDYPLIPEGLLWRVYKGDGYPFAFGALNLGPIVITNDPRPLVHKTINDYPEMFSQRAGYLMRDELSALAVDYVRWAVRIDPQHLQARLLADEYSIHGDPLRLNPSEEPRSQRELRGVSQ